MQVKLFLLFLKEAAMDFHFSRLSSDHRACSDRVTVFPSEARNKPPDALFFSFLFFFSFLKSYLEKNTYFCHIMAVCQEQWTTAGLQGQGTVFCQREIIILVNLQQLIKLVIPLFSCTTSAISGGFTDLLSLLFDFHWNSGDCSFKL